MITGGYEITTWRSLPIMKLRSLLFAGAAAAALALPAGAAAQATDTTSVTLTAGTLTFSDVFDADNFANTPLTGLAQPVNTGTGTWAVNDARGSLLGWNVKIRATRFSDGAVTPTKLPAGSLTYAGVGTSDISAGAGQLLTTGPAAVTVAAAIDSDSGTNDQAMANAILGNGGGTWNFAAKASGLTLVIPADAKAGTYTSTITTTLSGSPL